MVAQTNHLPDIFLEYTCQGCPVDNVCRPERDSKAEQSRSSPQSPRRTPPAAPLAVYRFASAPGGPWKHFFFHFVRIIKSEIKQITKIFSLGRLKRGSRKKREKNFSDWIITKGRDASRRLRLISSRFGVWRNEKQTFESAFLFVIQKNCWYRNEKFFFCLLGKTLEVFTAWNEMSMKACTLFTDDVIWSTLGAPSKTLTLNERAQKERLKFVFFAALDCSCLRKFDVKRAKTFPDTAFASLLIVRFAYTGWKVYRIMFMFTYRQVKAQASE